MAKKLNGEGKKNKLQPVNGIGAIQLSLGRYVDRTEESQNNLFSFGGFRGSRKRISGREIFLSFDKHRAQCVRISSNLLVRRTILQRSPGGVFHLEVARCEFSERWMRTSNGSIPWEIIYFRLRNIQKFVSQIFPDRAVYFISNLFLFFFICSYSNV